MVEADKLNLVHTPLFRYFAIGILGAVAGYASNSFLYLFVFDSALPFLPPVITIMLWAPVAYLLQRRWIYGHYRKVGKGLSIYVLSLCTLAAINLGTLYLLVFFNFPAPISVLYAIMTVISSVFSLVLNPKFHQSAHSSRNNL